MIFRGERTHLRIRLLREPGIEIADETGKLPFNVGEVQICAAPLGSPA